MAGERDGRVPAAMKTVRIHASTDETVKRLPGNWRVEHRFALKQALTGFDCRGLAQQPIGTRRVLPPAVRAWTNPRR